MSVASGRRVVLLDDGGVGALVAGMLRAEAGDRVTSWFWPGAFTSVQQRLAAVRRKVEMLGLEEVAGPNTDIASNASAGVGGLLEAQGLLGAAEVAVARGGTTVVWPAHAGDDLDELAQLAERARLVESIVRLESSNFGIEAPLLDLTTLQVAELAADMAAPIEGAWWCRRDGTVPCGVCQACMRWGSALSRADRGVGVGGAFAPGSDNAGDKRTPSQQGAGDASGQSAWNAKPEG